MNNSGLGLPHHPIQPRFGMRGKLDKQTEDRREAWEAQVTANREQTQAREEARQRARQLEKDALYLGSLRPADDSRPKPSPNRPKPQPAEKPQKTESSGQQDQLILQALERRKADQRNLEKSQTDRKVFEYANNALAYGTKEVEGGDPPLFNQVQKIGWNTSSGWRFKEGTMLDLRVPIAVAHAKTRKEAKENHIATKQDLENMASRLRDYTEASNEYTEQTKEKLQEASRQLSKVLTPYEFNLDEDSDDEYYCHHHHH